MSQDRRVVLYNGTGKGPDGQVGGAVSLQEQPLVIASGGLTGPVTIQYLQQETGTWVDLMANASAVQLTPENTFTFLSIQGSYRIKPGMAGGDALIWASEVTHVPEWDNGRYTDGGAAGGGAGITLPKTWTNLSGSISGRVGN